MLTITVFGQMNFVEISSHYDSETSIIGYKIDEPIILDINGGYGFKIKTPHEFTSFAIGWLSSTTNYQAGAFHVVYKVHKPGKGWSNWKTDEGETDPTETRRAFYQSGLLFGMDEYLHDSIEFYVHAPEGEAIQDLYLIIQDISKTINSKPVIVTESLGAKSCPEFPAIVPRSEWCGSYTACLNPTYTVTYRTPTHTVVHHGASPDSYTDGYAVVRSYWNYHVNSNGWSDIGYNYLFDKYGNFFQGRYNPSLPNTDVNAAHAGLANPYSIGLNFLGNSDAVNTAPTTPQLQKCSEFLAWWYDYKSFNPLSSASVVNQLGNTVTLPRICGHKDINPGGTTCPGTALYALIPSIKTSTNQIIVDCTTPSDTEAPTTSITTNRNWYNSEFETSFSDADNAGGTGVKHSFYQIMDYNGIEWRANGNEGYFNDNFTTAIHSDWTALWGTWSISAGRLLQTDEVSINTNIYASVAQESGNIYLYHWQQKISGSGTSKRSGMHFFCKDPTQAGRLESYMVYLRADGNTAEIYKYMNNSYSTTGGGLYAEGSYTIDPNIWYDVKVIFNTVTGVISLYIDNNLAATLIDPSPLTSGIAISPRTGGCQTEYDDIKVYKSRANTINVLPEESTVADIRYQSPSPTQEAGRIRTILVDNTGNWSASISKNIFTDFDVPTSSIAVSGTWQTDDFTASITDTDILSGVEKSFYNVSDYNGTKWSSNQNLGFVTNDFDSEIGTEWTSQIGTWSISGNHLTQTNEVETNTNISSYLQQDLSNRYLYSFDMNISGANANKRAGFHYFSDDPTLTNRGNGYFVWFRLASQELEFYKVTDNIFSLEKYYDIDLAADQWYNVKIVFDRITGETFVYLDDALVGEYLDSEPYQTGNYISFRSGNSIMSVDNFKVLRSRYPSTDISVGSAADAIRYQSSSSAIAAKINSVVSDSAKNISAISTKTLLIDWTNPSSIVTVNDGSATDIDTTYVLNQISANWTASSDANSGITAYYYAVGTTIGGTNLVNWTSTGLTTNFQNNSVSLVPGTIYYISIKSQNGASLFSNVKTSDGVRALNVPVVPICPTNSQICISGSAYALTGATPIGGAYSGTGVAAGIFNPQNAGTGLHTITYTLLTENCQFVIDVNPLPIVSCSGDLYVAVDAASFSLSGASPAGGTYKINGNPVTSFNPAVYGVGNFTVVYEYTNSPDNCTNSCSFIIYVFEPLVIDCTDNFSVCMDQNEFLLEGSTPPGGTYSGAGVSGGIFNPGTAGVGQHTINYNYSTESCNFIITVNELPVVTCPADINIYEDGVGFTLSGASPAGGVYTINGTALSVFNPQTYGAGSYSVAYTYTSSPENCENTCTFNINVAEPLVVNCPSNIEICENETAFTLSGATPLGGVYSGNGVSAGAFNPILAGQGIHNITYTYATGFCNFAITVNELPNVSCPGNITVSETSSAFPLTGGNPAGGQYSIGGNPVTYINPPSYGAGTYTVVYTIEGGTGNCENSCSFDVIIYEPVNISCPSGFSMCINDEETALSGGNPVGGTYSGAGVTGGVFNPAIAGQGEHSIAYIYGFESCNFIISVNALPILTCPADIYTNIYSNEFALSGGEPDNGWYEINGLTVLTFNPANYGVGTFTVNYYYENPGTGCLNNCSFNIFVSPDVNIISELQSNYKIYPNPNNGLFIIETGNSNSVITIDVVSACGQLLLTKNIAANSVKTQIDISEFCAGIYFIKLYYAEGVNVMKIVLEK